MTKALTLLLAASIFATPTDKKPEPMGSKATALDTATRKRAEKAIDDGLAFLARRQSAEGRWTDRYGPAVTAIVARAFVNDDDYGPKHPLVSRALDSILTFQQEDGGIYEKSNNLANYQTSVALLLLADVKDEKFEPQIKRAQKFLTELQYDPEESIDIDNAWYGGAGYSRTKRPDLSNTQMMLEALHNSGLPKSDPVYQRALKFVSRCQMNDATNDLPLADGADDGGFIYSPNSGGESKASQKLFEWNAPLRSYGTMTYAGFKSMLYADVSRDDPRLKACLKWIQNHYTIDSNPNMPENQTQEGLYYYFHVFSKALATYGEDTITDARGEKHIWRKDLCDKLVSLQQSDGHWINDSTRWLEGDANYVTAMAILSLQTALDNK